MADPIEKEYGERIEKLNRKISELILKLVKSRDSEKNQIYLELKNVYYELRKAYRWMISIDPILNRGYKMAIERVYCNEIYFYRKYLYAYNGDLDFNEFLQFVNLVYDFFYIKKFEVSIEYRRNLSNLVEVFSGEMTMIVEGLNKAIEVIHNDQNFKKNKFEYHNTLGDLHFQLYLLVKEFADYENEFMNDHLKRAINNYLLAHKYYEKKEIYKIINHLTIFDQYMKNNKIHHFLNIADKLKILKNKFPTYFN